MVAGVMSWTPYVGDPYSQVGETSPAVIGASNLNPSTRTSRGPGMSSMRRLLASMAGAVPWSQLTPDQKYFQDSVATGRWGAEHPYAAHAPASLITKHHDGTCDVTTLAVNGTAHLDLGGRGARVTAAGRP